MARKPRAPRIPKPRAHRGRTRVTLNGVDHYLGPWDAKKNRPTSGAEQQYQELIGRWLANGRRLPDDENEGLTVEDVLASYVLFAKEHYRSTNDSPSGELAQIRYALKPVRRLFGSQRAADFDAVALKTIQTHLTGLEFGHKKDEETGAIIEGTGKRLSRSTISDRINRIRRCFRWAESERLVPRGTWEHLRTVTPLKTGRSEAREPKNVEPVEWCDVEPVLPLLPGPLRAAVLVGWWAGLRPGETLRLTGRQIDRTVDPWRYEPVQHKNTWRGHPRIIRLGPESQKALRPYLKLDPDAAILSPKDTLAEQKAAKRAAAEAKARKKGRRYRFTPSRKARDARRRANPKRRVNEFYDVSGFHRAVERACDKAGVSRWHPYQLRHSCAKRLFLAGKIEEARAVLGQRTLEMTRWYAKLADEQLAARAMAEHG